MTERAADRRPLTVGMRDPVASSDRGNDGDSIREYWNTHIHDIQVARHPVGTPDFFRDLEAYRLEKLPYLSRLLALSACKGRRLVEVGCGVGTDLVRFAEAGARVTGVDLSERAVRLAELNARQRGQTADLYVMDGERLAFVGDSFDLAYAHGVLPYTADDRRMLAELHRVLKPGGEAIVQVYNRLSWLYVLSSITGTKLEHQDAPVFRVHCLRELRDMLRPFRTCRLIIERFPVKTRLHGGLKGRLYNELFVRVFNRLPRPLVRKWGWHIVAIATK
jgi:SAM-dependent methyltransferase